MGRAFIRIVAGTGLCLTAWLVGAQGVQHLSIIEPGGMPGAPVMTGIAAGTNGLTLTWDGPSGYYQLYQKTNLANGKWQALGKATNLIRQAAVPLWPANRFFRVSGPSAHYAGWRSCALCHGGTGATVTHTPHAQALQALAASGAAQDPSCLPCHSVGFGLPTGFNLASHTSTNLLAGVQCENCHGPAFNHENNEDDPTVRPQVDLAAQVCGGCHNAQFVPAAASASAPHPPFFEDWSSSPHSAVVPAALANMRSSAANIRSCGRCHSGSARLALLGGQDPSATLTNDFDVAITCGVCHDPHAQHVWTNVLSGVVYTNQLRNPLSSTNDYVMTTSANFSTAYNPNINLCAQCHNDRGAAWTDTARAPHHSPQYNMLLGTVGELTNGPAVYNPATHALAIQNQCADCHLQSATNDASGHTFEVQSDQLCANCHSDAASLLQFVTNSISTQIQQTKSYLDLWATTKAPADLRKYGARAWEYTTPGDLSPGGSGPNASEQAEIPDAIKMARFDLYLVLYDGSFGVHNGPFAVRLLNSADAFVEGQLYQ